MLWDTGTADFLAGKHLPWCFPILFCTEPLPHIRGFLLLICWNFWFSVQNFSDFRAFHFQFWSATIFSLSTFQNLSWKNKQTKNQNREQNNIRMNFSSLGKKRTITFTLLLKNGRDLTGNMANSGVSRLHSLIDPVREFLSGCNIVNISQGCKDRQPYILGTSSWALSWPYLLTPLAYILPPAARFFMQQHG